MSKHDVDPLALRMADAVMPEGAVALSAHVEAHASQGALPAGMAAPADPMVDLFPMILEMSQAVRELGSETTYTLIMSVLYDRFSNYRARFDEERYRALCERFAKAAEEQLSDEKKDGKP